MSHAQPATATDDRTAAALTEHLALDPYGGADHEVVVDSRGENQYRVDPAIPICECDDMTFRRPDGGCKHVRFARFALGIADLPAWAQTGRINRNVRDWRDRTVRGWADV